jgi:hypothetical protein
MDDTCRECRRDIDCKKGKGEKEGEKEGGREGGERGNQSGQKIITQP